MPPARDVGVVAGVDLHIELGSKVGDLGVFGGARFDFGLKVGLSDAVELRTRSTFEPSVVHLIALFSDSFIIHFWHIALLFTSVFIEVYKIGRFNLHPSNRIIYLIRNAVQAIWNVFQATWIKILVA